MAMLPIACGCQYDSNSEFVNFRVLPTDLQVRTNFAHLLARASTLTPLYTTGIIRIAWAGLLICCHAYQLGSDAYSRSQPL